MYPTGPLARYAIPPISEGREHTLAGWAGGRVSQQSPGQRDLRNCCERQLGISKAPSLRTRSLSWCKWPAPIPWLCRFSGRLPDLAPPVERFPWRRPQQHDYRSRDPASEARRIVSSGRSQASR